MTHTGLDTTAIYHCAERHSSPAGRSNPKSSVCEEDELGMKSVYCPKQAQHHYRKEEGLGQMLFCTSGGWGRDHEPENLSDFWNLRKERNGFSPRPSSYEAACPANTLTSAQEGWILMHDQKKKKMIRKESLLL